MYLFGLDLCLFCCKLRLYFLSISYYTLLRNISQEIIKVRERIRHIDVIPKEILLKLFLDIVPSSSMDITRELRGCFRGVSVYNVSFHFKAKKCFP